MQCPKCTQTLTPADVLGLVQAAADEYTPVAAPMTPVQLLAAARVARRVLRRARREDRTSLQEDGNWRCAHAARGCVEVPTRRLVTALRVLFCATHASTEANPTEPIPADPGDEIMS